MATALNTRHFSKPGDLRGIAPENLLSFLSKESAFFESKGYPLPADPAQLDHERISLLLSDPEGMSDAFQQALFEINELANPDLFDLILDEIEQQHLQWAHDIGQDISPADLALLVFMNSPDLIKEIHSQDYISKPKSFQYFLAKKNVDRAFRYPSESKLEELTHGLNATFLKRRRGHTARVIIRERDGLVYFLVRHGEQYSRQAVIQDGESSSLFFRPEKYDLLVYNPTLGELRMTAKSKWLQNLYLAEFGNSIFGSSEFFGSASRFNLSPLRENGKDAISSADFPQIESVTLKEIQIYHGSALGQVEIRRANDLFASLETMDEPFPQAGELRRASFLIKLKNTARPHTLKIGTDNIEEVKNDQDRDLFDQWLRARGFIREYAADDE